LLAPLTEPSNGTSDVSLARIADELRGAYLSQQYVNTKGDLPFGIRLVLANEGSSEQGEGEVVSQLKQLTAFPGRLLAVAGIGISVQATETAAQALGAGGANIPMFGAVTTANPLDNATNADLVRVVPDVAVQLKVLLRALEQPGQLTAGDVANALPGLYVGDSLEGATGNFSITTNGDLNSDDVPIIQLANGTETILRH
jgi:ABC-type branched-subunit amino acid transport system substrate-binding protein